MLTTIEAEIDEDGGVIFLEPLKIKKKSRAIITLLDPQAVNGGETRRPGEVEVDKEQKERQLTWLKANRDKYADKYVALDGDVLLGVGESIDDVQSQISGSDAKNIFIVKVFAEETVVSAGFELSI